MAIIFVGLVATNYISGSAGTPQNLFTLENSGSESPVIVDIRRLVVQLDATAALTAQMPIVRTSRLSSLPSGGTVLPKGSFNTTQTSATSVIARSAAAIGTGAGGAVLTAITATEGDTLWQQYCMRLHTAVGQVLGLDNSVLPTLIENTSFVLRPNEAILVQVNAVLAAHNPNTNRWFVQCVWEEET